MREPCHAAARVGAVLSLVLLTAGCGALLTGGVAGGIFASGSKSKGGGITPNRPPRVEAAAVAGDTSLGSVTFNVTISDPEGDPVRAEVRYSTDPNENASQAFARLATGTFATAGVGSASGTQNGGAIATTSAGASYAFTWNTAQDLGATKTDNVRLQIVINGDVGFTVSSFTVDNTGVPLVVSAAPTGLPAGASVYSDEQNGFQGFVAIQLVLAQSEAQKVDLSVSLSTDGGLTFPNAAVGRLFDAGGAEVPLTGVATSQGGTTYTFRFLSGSSGLGTTGDTGVVARFVARSTKTGAPRDTAPFTVNNAPFTATVLTPSRSDVTDKVDLTYVLFDAASDPLDVVVQVSPTGVNATHVVATESPQLPSEGTNNLSTQPTGKEHHFVWNAFYDMIARGLTVTPATFNASVQLVLTKRKTQVSRGPFRATTFSVDQRLIATVFNRGVAAASGTPNDQVVLGQPEHVAEFGNSVYFSDGQNGLIRAIDFSGTGTPTVNVYAGGGQSTVEGELASEVGFQFVNGLSSSRKGSGALLISGTLLNGDSGIFRVDGATPLLTSLFRTPPGQFFAGALVVDGLTDTCFYVGVNNVTRRTEIRSITTVGQNDALVAGNGTTDGENQPAATSAVPFGVRSLACNQNLVPGLLFYAINVSGTANGTTGGPGAGPPISNVRAINLSAFPVTFAGKTIPGNAVATVATNVQARVSGISVNFRDAFDATFEDRHQIVRFRSTGEVDVIAGTGAPGFAGDGDLAVNARFTAPRGLCNDNTGSATQGSFFVCDAGNARVRRVRPTAVAPVTTNVNTVAGTTPEVLDGQPAPIARLSAPSGIAGIGSGIIIADTFNSRVRGVDETSLAIVTIGGNGASGIPVDKRVATNQPISAPAGIARRGASDIFIASFVDHVVELMSLDNQGRYEFTRLAGTGVANVGSDSADARTQPLSNPAGIDYYGGLLVVAQTAPPPAQGFLSAINVGSVTTTHWGVTIPPGGIARIAGGGVAQAGSTSRTAALACELRRPTGVVIDKDGRLFVADAELNLIMDLDEAGTGLQVVAGNPTPDPLVRDLGGRSALELALFEPLGITLERPNERVLYVYEKGFGGMIRGVRIGGNNSTQVQGVPFPVLGNVEVVVGGFSELDGALSTDTRVGSNVPQAVTMLEKQGNLYYPDVDFAGNSRVRVVNDSGFVRTIAGANDKDVGDTLPNQAAKLADNATLTRPSALAVAPDGRVFVCDSGRVRSFAPDTNVVTRVAGTSFAASFGDGVPAVNAGFAYTRSTSVNADVATPPYGPSQLALSGTGYVSSLLAVADTLGGRIAIVNLGATATYQGLGTIQTGELRTLPVPVALAVTAPAGVAFASSGLVLIADGARILGYNTSNATVRCCGVDVGPGTGEVLYPQAGYAALVSPRNVLWEPTQNLIVFSDQSGAPGEDAVFVLNTTDSLTVSAYGLAIDPLGVGAGTTQQPTGIAFGRAIRGLGLDPVSGDVYYARADGDTLDPHHQVRVKRFADAAEQPFAGSGVAGFTGDGGIATSAQLDTPVAVGVDRFGSVYVLDARNLRIRRCRQFP